MRQLRRKSPDGFRAAVGGTAIHQHVFHLIAPLLLEHRPDRRFEKLRSIE
jgi:hypothetical protein